MPIALTGMSHQKRGCGEHGGDAAPLHGSPTTRILRHVRHPQPDRGAATALAAARTREHRSPRRDRQRSLERGGGEQRAGAARDHDPARERRLAILRVPRGERLQRRHQACRAARADQRARGDEGSQAAGQRERQRARSCDHQQRGLDAPRSVAVEQHADRQLQRPERDEVASGQQPQLAGSERHLAREVGRDDRVDHPKQVRQQVAGGEREIQPREADRRRRSGGRSLAASAAKDEVDGAMDTVNVVEIDGLVRRRRRG
jgi:hypothetical protein